eukprot:4335440-Pleurochrysis_carterae.AAC.1
MTDGLEEDERTREVLTAIFPDGMHLEDAHTQLQDIHEFVREAEERDERTLRRVDTFDDEVVVTEAELPRRHVRKIYVALARHEFRLVHMEKIETNGRETLKKLEVRQLITPEELVVYLAKAFLPDLAITEFNMQAEFQRLQITPFWDKNVRLVGRRG